MCHAGLGEYIIPIFSDEILLGALNVGFFQNDENRTVKRIARTCATKPPLSVERAICLYHDNIASPTIDIRLLLPGLEMLAEYLGQTYKLFHYLDDIIIQVKIRFYPMPWNTYAAI